MKIVNDFLGNGQFIKSKKDAIIKIPIGLIVIAVFGISPYLIGFAGAWITEKLTGNSCHEGNCIWMVIPWFGFITLPLAFSLMVAFFVLVFKEH